MSGLKEIKGYSDFVVNICPDNTAGDIIDISGISIQLPEKPDNSEVLFSSLPVENQCWKRI